jgi:hypothetical protein
VGLVFSEYALADPLAWTYLRPILAANGGYAMMISTPRGKNHLFGLYNMAKDDPDWFASMVTVAESGVLSQATIDRELREMIAERGPDEGTAKFNQEYFCSFDVAIEGSFYGGILDQLEANGQITAVPHDPALSVVTSWDLGMKDPTNVWFFQHYGQQIRVIDCYATTGEGVDAYARMLKDRRYNYESHIMPHDVRVREIGTNAKTRYEVLQSLGVYPITVAPRIPVYDGINAVRMTLPRMWFDKKKCAAGLEALRFYHKEYDEIMKRFRDNPEKDWSGHYCLPAGQLIKTTRGKVPIEAVLAGDEVVLPTGELGLVEASGQTGCAAKIIEITTENGCVLRCTPNHKLLTPLGIVTADSLGYTDSILTQGGKLWRNERWSTKAETIIDSLTDITRIVLRGEESLRTYIEMFGKTLMGLCQMAMSFIISTMTPVTTTLAISNSWKDTNTLPTTAKTLNGISPNETEKPLSEHESFLMYPDAAPRTEQGPLNGGRQTQSYMNGSLAAGLRDRWMRCVDLRLSGTEAKKDWLGIENTESRVGRTARGFLLFVNTAVRRFLLRSRIVRSSATRIVKLEHFAVDEIPVYNLAIKNHQCYLAQGLLVSNSDSMRYYCVGYRRPVKSQSVTEIMAKRSFPGVW